MIRIFTIYFEGKYEPKYVTNLYRGLKKRVHELEHIIYPKVIKEISQGKITLLEGKVIKI